MTVLLLLKFVEVGLPKRTVVALSEEPCRFNIARAMFTNHPQGGLFLVGRCSTANWLLELVDARTHARTYNPKGELFFAKYKQH